jgi:hypothetical protein
MNEVNNPVSVIEDFKLIPIKGGGYKHKYTGEIYARCGMNDFEHLKTGRQYRRIYRHPEVTTYGFKLVLEDLPTEPNKVILAGTIALFIGAAIWVFSDFNFFGKTVFQIGLLIIIVGFLENLYSLACFFMAVGIYVWQKIQYGGVSGMPILLCTGLVFLALFIRLYYYLKSQK